MYYKKRKCKVKQWLILWVHKEGEEEKDPLYPSWYPPHFLQNVVMLVTGVLVEFCCRFTNRLETFRVVERQQHRTVRADVYHLQVSFFCKHTKNCAEYVQRIPKVTRWGFSVFCQIFSLAIFHKIMNFSPCLLPKDSSSLGCLFEIIFQSWVSSLYFFSVTHKVFCHPCPNFFEAC